jgi:hypothetical protein
MAVLDVARAAVFDGNGPSLGGAAQQVVTAGVTAFGASVATEALQPSLGSAAGHVVNGTLDAAFKLAHGDAKGAAVAALKKGGEALLEHGIGVPVSITSTQHETTGGIFGNSHISSETKRKAVNAHPCTGVPVAVGVHVDHEKSKFRSGDHVVDREAWSVGGHASIGPMMDVSLGVASGIERSDVVSRRHGDVITDSRYERNFSGQLRLGVRAGSRGDAVNLTPAWASTTMRESATRNADGSALRESRSGGALTPILTDTAPATAAALLGCGNSRHSSSVIGRAEQLRRQDGRLEQVFEAVTRDTDDTTGFGIINRTVTKETLDVGVVTNTATALGETVRVGDEVQSTMTQRRVAQGFEDLRSQQVRERNWWSTDDRPEERFDAGAHRKLKEAVIDDTTVTVSSKHDGSALGPVRETQSSAAGVTTTRSESDWSRVNEHRVTTDKRQRATEGVQVSTTDTTSVIGTFTETAATAPVTSVVEPTAAIAADALRRGTNLTRTTSSSAYKSGEFEDVRRATASGARGNADVTYAAGEKRLYEAVSVHNSRSVTVVAAEDGQRMYSQEAPKDHAVAGVTGTLTMDVFHTRQVVNVQRDYAAGAFSADTTTQASGLFSVTQCTEKTTDQACRWKGSGAALESREVTSTVSGTATTTIAAGSTTAASADALNAAVPHIPVTSFAVGDKDFKAEATAQVVHDKTVIRSSDSNRPLAARTVKGREQVCDAL